MPRRNVANRGALMKANTNWRKSIRLLNRLATYAARILTSIPNTVVSCPTRR